MGFAGLLLLQFDFWIWGAAGEFCFLLDWTGLGWAGLPFRESSKLLKRQFNSKRYSHNFCLSCS